MRDDNLTFNYIVFAVLAIGVIFGYSKMFPPPGAAPAAKEEAAAAPERTQNRAPAPSEPVRGTDLWAHDSRPPGETVEIDTPLYTARVDTGSGEITSWVLKHYRESPEPGSPPLNLISDRSTAPEAALSFEDGTKAAPFRYDGEQTVRVEGLAREVALTYRSGGVRVVKKLSFSPDTYIIGGRYEITNTSGRTFEYASHFLQNGEVEQGSYGPAEALVLSVAGERKQFNGADDAGQTLSGRVDWLGFSKKYFILAALPESGELTEVHTGRAGGNTVKTRFSYGRFSVPPGGVSVRRWKAYMGPKRESLLRGAGYGFENAIDYGWFGTLSKLAVRVLKYTDRFFNNYGISILVITLVFRLLFLPLSIRGMRSMKDMQKKMERIKPKLDALKEKFKGDKKRQNEEMMRLYTSHGINPLSSLGGCLPMLAQVPVFIALYYGLLYSIDLRHSSFLWIDDLSAPENLFNIPWTPVPFRILPLAMGISWWFSTKLTPTPAAGDTAAMQAKIMQFMPVVFTFIMWDFPSGLVLYWTASNLLSVAQQVYINRSG
ncbi:MAG: membrane protein insertase YidC [Candidatus Dadabacteria bacterium]|nr:membrane protein insertase YidC [Candidatus Dadabacteria bacterium]